MPIMRNISQRTFIIAGKQLKRNEEGEFDQKTIDIHVAMYKGELEQIGKPINVHLKVDTKEVSEKVEELKKDPDLTEEKVNAFVGSVDIEHVQSEKEDEVSLKVTTQKYVSKMSKTELQQFLKEKGVDFPEDSTVSELRDMAK